MLNIMLKKSINIFMSVFLLLPLLTGMSGSYGESFLVQIFLEDNHPQTSFKKPCDMDDCNPNMPKCPLCPSSGSTSLYLHNGTGAYLPTPIFFLIQLSVNTLSDQGFVKRIFRPPTSIL